MADTITYVSLPRVSASALGKVAGWWIWTMRADGTNALIMLHCSCGQNGEIRHEIAADGTVSPSVGCGWGCGFHVHARLEGWTGGVRPRVSS
jgi:hypothetical protein